MATPPGCSTCGRPCSTRIGVSLVLVWIVATIVFLAIRLVPGDPAELSQGGVG